MPVEPHHERVMRSLRERIASGDLPPGTKLPTTADLATEYGVGTTTVRQAVKLLQFTGELVGHQGVGVFVPEVDSGA